MERAEGNKEEEKTLKTEGKGREEGWRLKSIGHER